MGFQTLIEAINGGNIPAWISSIPHMNWEVYVGNVNGIDTTQAGCPVIESVINIDKIGQWYALKCWNLLEWWLCAKTWDWESNYQVCSLLWMFESLKKQEV